MQKFYLQRIEDESGVSGTGRVAEGVIFANGWCALTWLTEYTCVANYKTIDDLIAVHGHGGKTRLVLEYPISGETGVRVDGSPDQGFVVTSKCVPDRMAKGKTVKQALARFWGSHKAIADFLVKPEPMEEAKKPS
jgi:hypothetical protein